MPDLMWKYIGFAISRLPMPRLWLENRRLRARITLLEEKIAGEVSTETFLRDLHFQSGEFDMTFEPSRLAMEALGRLMFTAMDGAENYQTGTMTVRTRKYELTLRHVDGKTPAERIEELETSHA